MERALDLGLLTAALAGCTGIPDAEELQQLMADVEVQLFVSRPTRLSRPPASRRRRPSRPGRSWHARPVRPSVTVPDPRMLLADHCGLAVRVHVTPAQPGRLALAKAAQRGQVMGGVQPVLSDRG